MISSELLLREAHAAGFPLAGLAQATPLDPAPLRRWIDQGMAGCVAPWMAARQGERLDPTRLLPGARTVLSLGCCVLTGQHLAASPIALYAQGRDYHATMSDRLRTLRRGLGALFPALHSYASADTGPVMEKAWAERAGLGWIGKNGLLITRGHGSRVVLAALVLDDEVDRYDGPHDRVCGTCTRCVEACPTGALVAPGVVDARRCLSCQTIEDHGEYALALRPHARLAFGCEACQDACPWNLADHACDDARFLPRPIAQLSLLELAALSQERWRELTKGTAVSRARFEGLRRNALVALGAARDPRVVQVQALAEDADPTVRSAARWALERAGVILGSG